MANEIRSSFGTLQNLLTAADTEWDALANDDHGQTDMVNNTVTLWQLIHIFVKINLNASSAATADRPVTFFGLHKDQATETIEVDGALDTANATIVIKNAESLRTFTTGPAPATSGDASIIEGHFKFWHPGAFWALGIHQQSGQTLGIDHLINWYGENPEVQ